MLACWESYCCPVLWVMLGGEKQQRGSFGQGMIFPESEEGKIPRELEKEGECVPVYVSLCLWEEEAAALCWVCIRPSKKTFNVC